MLGMYADLISHDPLVQAWSTATGLTPEFLRSPVSNLYPGKKVGGGKVIDLFTAEGNQNPLNDIPFLFRGLAYLQFYENIFGSLPLIPGSNLCNHYRQAINSNLEALRTYFLQGIEPSKAPSGDVPLPAISNPEIIFSKQNKRCLLEYRAYQSKKDVCHDASVRIFAPSWVDGALTALARDLHGTTAHIVGEEGEPFIRIEKTISLKQLVALARNERANVTGIIKFALYGDLPRPVVITLRDLAKHCVIVGKDIATHFGGYGSSEPIPLNQEVFICDLPGLQFQKLYNTGRHVLISEKDTLPKGILDDLIFSETVGQKKATFKEAQENPHRYLPGTFGSFEDTTNILFDTYAYQCFVAQDVVLSGLALNQQARSSLNQKSLNFKFLKYGCGFFADNLAGQARTQLSLHLALGVKKGLMALFQYPPEYWNQIKGVELPFYKAGEDNPDAIQRVLDDIAKFCHSHGLSFDSSNRDALAPHARDLTTGTTNCSDPHAPTGNEMNYMSVDATIAENLAKKGHQFNPVCNRGISETYLPIAHLAIEKEQIAAMKPGSLTL